MQAVPLTEICQRLVSPESLLKHPLLLLVVLAHPDDEVLALGGRLELLTEARFITVTDGVPLDGNDARDHGFGTLQSYGIARRAELASALHHAGLPPQNATTLSVPGPATIPDQRAPFSLTPIVLALTDRLRQFQPQAVLTHPYEGGHPDHDACAFAVQAAVQVATRLTGTPIPVLEAPFYHAGPHGIQTGVFLSGDPGIPAHLTPAQSTNKQQRLDCFKSQAATLSLFGTAMEQYRTAPAYDFTQPPHPGQLYYERFPWGMDGARFCALAHQSAQELGL